MNQTLRTFCLGLVVVLAASQTSAMAQAPAAAPTTLWSFLGIPQAVGKVNAQVFNRRGNTPRLESRPPLRSLADPRNLQEGMPDAVKKAAEIKQAEDLAPQKKKAIKYLASVGCGCYDKEGDVTKALVASMGDCTESVRMEAVEAIKTAASEDPCCQCGSKCCCKKEILEKLAELAYLRGNDGCFKEPSERVRKAAAEALTVCCSTQEPVEILNEPEQKSGSGNTETIPDEPTQAPTPAPTEDNPQPANGEPSSDAAPTTPPDASASVTYSLSAYINAGTGTYRPAQATTVAAKATSETTPVTAETSESASETPKVIPIIPRRGEVTEVNSTNGTARVKFNSLGEVPNGNLVMAFHQFLFAKSQIGEYVVVTTQGSEAIIRNAEGGSLGKLSKGDLVIVK